MAETFDPYRKWLGIPPSQQPPHLYRLLGVELFEEDAEVIDTAASQRMSYLQELGGGPHVKESQRLLNEVSAARRCLLDKKKKAEYDAELRSKLAAAAPKSPPPKPPPVQVASRLADDDDDTVTITVGDLAATKRRSSTAKSAGAKSPAAKNSDPGKDAATATPEGRPPSRRRKNPMPWLIGLLMFVVCAAGATAYVLFGRRSADNAADDAPMAYNATTTGEAPTAMRPRDTLQKPRATGSSPNFLTSTSQPATQRATPPATVPAPVPSATPMTTNFFAPQPATATATAVATATPVVEPPPAPTAPTATAVATAEDPPASVASLFTTDDQVSRPDVRPHFLPAGKTLYDIHGGFREGNDYHLFYNATVVQSKSVVEIWGHAVSRDLFTWTEVKSPKPPVDAKLSPKIGTVFLDRGNASGRGKPDAPAWLAAFSYAPSGDAKKGTAIGLAVSTDRGQTWTAEEQPIVKAESGLAVRFPQLFRHEVSKQWCLLTWIKKIDPAAPAATTSSRSAAKAAAAAAAVPPKSEYRLSTSSDLKSWEKKQDIVFHAGGAPAELIELPAADDPKQSKWMFLHGRGRYWLGDFDGTRFTTGPTVYPLQVDTGLFGFTVLDEEGPAGDGLMSAFSASGVGDGLAFPRRLQLTKSGGVSTNTLPLPAAWLAAAKANVTSNHALSPDAPLKLTEQGGSFQVQLRASADAASDLHLVIFGTALKFDFKNKQLLVGSNEPVGFPGTDVQIDGTVDMHLVELYVGGVGQLGFRAASGPEYKTPLTLKSVGGSAQIKSLTLTPINPPKPSPAETPPKP